MADLVDLVDLPPMVLILEALLLPNPPTDINCMQFWSRRDKLVVKLETRLDQARPPRYNLQPADRLEEL